MLTHTLHEVIKEVITCTLHKGVPLGNTFIVLVKLK